MKYNSPGMHQNISLLLTQGGNQSGKSGPRIMGKRFTPFCTIPLELIPWVVGEHAILGIRNLIKRKAIRHGENPI
jgi:hypothetical protein